MKSKYNYFFVLFVVLLCIPFVNAVENSNRTMTSGTFGVAWLDSEGVVRVYDGQSVLEPISDIRFSTIAAADVLEEGSDQLLLLDNVKQALHVYSFKTKKIIGPFGSNVKTIATGYFSAGDKYLSVIACTNAGDTFRWSKEVMDKSWLRLPGVFSQVVSAKLNSRNNTDDFVVITEGNLYIFTPQWQTYSIAVADKKAAALISGNFTTSPNDEIVFLDKSGSVFLLQNQSVEDLKLKTTCVVAGKNSNNTDSLYALNNARKPIVYNRESKSWKDVPFKNAFACTNLITRTKVDGNGHELFVVSGNELYQIDQDGTAKQLSTGKGTKVILKSGDFDVADYRYKNVPFKPYISKLRTPSGRNILRDAPFDHLHHHGLMFALWANDCDFWTENSSRCGKQMTVSIKPQEESTSDLQSEIEWRNGNSKSVLKEQRRISVLRGDGVVFLNWQSKLVAEYGDVEFDKRNHHYAGLGLRFDQSMDKGGRFFSDSDSNKFVSVRNDERLTECKWMAYTAKLDGKPVTVAVFGYSDNPIPTLAFTMGDSGKPFAYLGISLNFHRKPVILKSGESLECNYLIAVWVGEVTAETIEKIKPQKP
jgi:hypothetical protein